MISRKLAGASAAGVGAATAVAALLLGTLSGSAADASTASAYGLAAKGLVPISPTPHVQAPPDGHAALVDLPSPLGVGVLKVKAEGHTSSATAVDLNIADLVKAKVIEAKCDNGTADSSILSGEVAGTKLPSNPGVGQKLDLSPIATVEFNRQSDNADGTRTVDALVVSVLPGGALSDVPLTPKALDQLKGIVPNLKVPSIGDLKTGQTPGETHTAPTVQDLVQKLKELNPNVQLPTAGGGPLLQIVISSATCGAAKESPTTVPPATIPKPIQTQLPVTH
ncbi:MAG TPA: choice-of-anchor P family protein [Pseudonocardiaceae bacterium]